MYIYIPIMNDIYLLTALFNCAASLFPIALSLAAFSLLDIYECFWSNARGKQCATSKSIQSYRCRAGIPEDILNFFLFFSSQPSLALSNFISSEKFRILYMKIGFLIDRELDIYPFTCSLYSFLCRLNQVVIFMGIIQHQNC